MQGVAEKELNQNISFMIELILYVQTLRLPSEKQPSEANLFPAPPNATESSFPGRTVTIGCLKFVTSNFFIVFSYDWVGIPAGECYVKYNCFEGEEELASGRLFSTANPENVDVSWLLQALSNCIRKDFAMDSAFSKIYPTAHMTEFTVEVVHFNDKLALSAISYNPPTQRFLKTKEGKNASCFFRLQKKKAYQFWGTYLNKFYRYTFHFVSRDLTPLSPEEVNQFFTSLGFPSIISRDT